MLCKSPALTAIPVDLPSDAVKFRLERTSVSRIFRGAFSAMPELLYLWLTYNSITVLHPRSFTNLSFLHELRWMGTSCPPSPGRDSGMCPASERSDCTITAWHESHPWLRVALPMWLTWTSRVTGWAPCPTIWLLSGRSVTALRPSAQWF